MSSVVQIGPHFVGAGHPVFVVAEIGINHNGDVETAKKLIAAAAVSGCDAVKFQKRTVDIVYTAKELGQPRESAFGLTNGDLKRGLEFGEAQYQDIAVCCRQLNILWFASCWDEGSVLFMEAFSPPCYKIASPSLTNDQLLRALRKTGRAIVLSTGMSTLSEIDHAVDVLGKDNLMLTHCTSTYPSRVEELNLRVIPTLRKRYGVPVGYSGHEVGLATTIAAVALGACWIERHITMDRAMWGSDQSASVEPQGFYRLVKGVRALELALGDGVKRVYDSEIPFRQKLRRVG